MAEKTNQTAAPETPVADAGPGAQESTDRAVQLVQEAAADATPRDQVLIPSLHADGTPAQTENFELIGDPEFTKDVVTRQLREQRVSAVDHAARTALAGAGTGEEGPQDPVIEALTNAHEQAAEGVERDAARLVERRKR